MLYLTADWHLGDTRFEIMQRPFKTSEEMLDLLIERYNSIVTLEDEVIVVGDAVYDPDYLQYVSRFNGKKTLIRGNHDRKFTDEELLVYFDKVVAEDSGIEVKLDSGLSVYLTHYPSATKINLFNAVGHIHSAWKVQMNMVNVGVDVHHFYPIEINTLQFFYTAICNYYDNDIFAGYLSQNECYRHQRGKESTYFKG